MATGRTALSSVPTGTPVTTDSVVFNDASDGSLTKQVTIAELLALRTDFAEIRNGFLTNLQSGTYSTTATQCVFEANEAYSSAAAGDADAGTVLTADQANNKIIVPANTLVLVEFRVAMFTAGVTASDAVTYYATAKLGSTLQSQTTGAAGQATNSAPGSTPVTVTGSGIVANTTASAADLTLDLFFSGSRSGSQDLAQLRAWKIGAA